VAVDVEPAKGAQIVISEEPVVGVDIVQVIHETERSVALDTIVTLQPVDSLDSKAPDVVHAGLVTAIEVLASELGDPDGQLESVGPLLDVGLEVHEMYVIPMRGYLINMATRALLHEAGHPIEAIRGGGSARAPENVTLVCERLDICAPCRDAIRDGHVRLGWFVDLVETKYMASITGLGVLEEIVDTVLVSTPEHDADRDTRVLDSVRNDDVPKMEHLDTGGRCQKGYSRVIAHSPSNSELSRTRRGRRGWGIRWGGVGRAGARGAR